MIYLIFGVAEMISLVCAGPDVSYPAIASLSAFLAASLFRSLASQFWCSSLLPLQFLLVSYHAVRRIHLIANFPSNFLLLTAFQKSY